MERAPDEATFAARVRARLVDPTAAMVPVVAVAFWGARELGLIAPTPLWVTCALLVAAFCCTAVATGAWGQAHTGWQLWARIAVNTAGITVVMYGIGWGPMLAIGLVFGAVDNIRLSGTRAVAPTMVLSVACLAAGDGAIAIGVAPTLVSEPLVHGLAVLAALGVVFTIKQFERATVETERAQVELRQNERRFRALVQHASDIIMVVARDASLRYVSPAFEAILGYTAEEAATMSGWALVHDDDADALHESIAGGLTDNRAVTEARLMHRDGSWRWFDVTVTPVFDNPSVEGWVANLRDITDRKAAAAALNEAQEAFRHAFDDAPIGMGLVGVDGRVLRSNRAFAALLGRPQDEVVGLRISELTHPDDRAMSDAQRTSLNRGEIDSYRMEKRYLRPDGTTVWASLSVSTVRGLDGEVLYQIGQVEDISERKTLSDQLAYEATHDALTGLSNRSSFTERVTLGLAEARGDNATAAVLFIDLDQFKLINDSLGHVVGDAVLVTISRRLRDAVRPDDVVARFGGDEFVVLCPGVTGIKAASKVAHRLIGAISEPITVAGDEFFVTASVGIALAGPDDTAETLLRHADIAMYQAKDNGRAGFATFHAEDHGSAVQLLRTGTELHRALERDELTLHYQPVLDLATGQVIAFEALLRWNHPDRGLLLPGDFINLAEESGLIVPIGAWALETACAQTVRWQANDRRAKGVVPLAVNVNLSPRQLADPRLGRTVARILERTGIAPTSVCLELTENTLMHDTESAVKVLHALRNQGVHISIDDFGTGYSSLSYLKRFPVAALKIDRTFIDGLGSEVEDTTIVEAVVMLAHALGLTAVAEGVETPAQLDALRALGCDFAQGFLIGRPTAAEAIGDRVARDLQVWPRPTAA